ncbi:MAG TPA: DUF262 domain-containing HNH endonuclease family protein [Ktedonobacteraceae bacterium]|nr:DUF262 domain-containing HNH endonuclease family protein [Ktedonobacteraceae bacterium]
MNKMTIRGAEYPIRKIFSDDFVFTIPLYQRAYSWTAEESEELLQDLLRAMKGFSVPIDDLDPYFLGSIVLIKGDNPEAQVVDGQQRLSTLTMLLAVLRSLSQAEDADSLTSFLSEKANKFIGTPARHRLSLRKLDREFFHTYIQDEGGIERLKDLSEAQLSESQTHIRDNTLGFIRELQKMTPDQLMTLTQFIINRCFLVVVAVDSSDLDSVYRIFSILNSRGLDLSYPDILKAEIINAVPLQLQEEYTAKWEEIEALLGSQALEDLFEDLRTIFARQRMLKGMIEEFRHYVYPGQPQSISAQEFIDNILVRYAHAYNYILRTNYQHGMYANEINAMFRWLNQIDRGRWVPTALYYFFEYVQQPDLVLRFLTDLERLALSFELCRVPPYKRIDRYCELLDAIYHKEDLFVETSPLQLSPRECRQFILALDGNIYQMHHVCRYVLLRLDASLSEGIATYDYQTVSVEHILPQRPSIDSEWASIFPTREVREKYVHKLGNLLLLSRGKNIRAENYDFEYKKQYYFSTANGISPFVLTTQVLRYQQWTPPIIEQRQVQMVNTAKKLWRL